MTPGIYENIPDPDYRAIDAVSNSGLDAWLRGPGKKSSGRFFLVGSVLHAMVLEGMDATMARYETAEEEFKLNTKIGKRYLAEYKATGKEIIKPSEWTSICGMYEAVMRHEDARRIIDDMQRTELTVIGQQDGFEALCKCRIDAECSNVIADLKTTHCLNEVMFEDSFTRYGYNVQAAYYADLYKTVSNKEMPFVFICVSSVTPHPVWISYVTPSQMASGRQYYQAMLKLYERYEIPAKKGEEVA